MTVLDWPAVDDGIQLAFGEPLGDDPMVLAAIHDCMPLDRTFTAWDADRFVGSTASERRRLAVPGGQVDAAAVTVVAVARPYRRRGVLRSLMTAQLDAVAAAGEPLAILFASEATIYGRYGYGGAGPRAEVDIDLARSTFGDRGRAALVQFRESGGFLTEHTSHDVVAELAAVVDTLASVRPGMMTRPDAQWRRMTLDSPSGRGGATEQRAVVARAADGSPVGFARFAIRPGWTGHLAEGTVLVRELAARTIPAEAALWRYLLDTDLSTALSASMRPIVELLAEFLADPRQRRATVGEGLWVRLLSVPDALAARTFSAPIDLVLDVLDDFRPDSTATAGRFRVVVSAPDTAAVVTPTHQAPDLRLSVAALGAVHLGTIRMADLLDVVELTPGALVAATRAWAWHATAWSPEMF